MSHHETLGEVGQALPMLTETHIIDWENLPGDRRLFDGSGAPIEYRIPGSITGLVAVPLDQAGQTEDGLASEDESVIALLTPEEYRATLEEPYDAFGFVPHSQAELTRVATLNDVIRERNLRGYVRGAQRRRGFNGVKGVYHEVKLYRDSAQAQLTYIEFELEAMHGSDSQSSVAAVYRNMSEQSRFAIWEYFTARFRHNGVRKRDDDELSRPGLDEFLGDVDMATFVEFVRGVQFNAAARFSYWSRITEGIEVVNSVAQFLGDDALSRD